jgi:hypothetical protein
MLLVRFDFHTAVTMKITVLLDVIPCSLVSVLRCFRRTSCFLPQGREILAGITFLRKVAIYQIGLAYQIKLKFVGLAMRTWKKFTTFWNPIACIQIDFCTKLLSPSS